MTSIPSVPRTQDFRTEAKTDDAPIARLIGFEAGGCRRESNGDVGNGAAARQPDGDAERWNSWELQWASAEHHRARADLEKAFEEIKCLRDQLHDENVVLREQIGTRRRVSGPSGATAKLSLPPSTFYSKIRSPKINKRHFQAR